MSTFSITMPSGEAWEPKFVQTINEETCIGCGRCFKGERVKVSDDEDDDEEYEKKVMTIAHQEMCIGCTACSKICPKKCYTHAAATV